MVTTVTHVTTTLVEEARELELALANVHNEEANINASTASFKARRDALLKNKHALEAKIVAIDRNRAMVSTRLSDIEDRLAASKHLLEEGAKQHSEMQTAGGCHAGKAAQYDGEF